MARRVFAVCCVLLLSLTTFGCSSQGGVDVDSSPTTVTAGSTAATVISTEPQPPFELVGTWNAELDYAPSLEQLGVKTDAAFVTVRCTFYEDGTYQFEAQNEDFYDVIRPHTDTLIQILSDLEQPPLSAEEYLDATGLTKDSFTAYFVELAGLAEGMSAVYGTYRFEGEDLIMDDEPAEYVYDGNGVSVTSMGMTVVFTPYIPPVTQAVTTTTAPAVTPNDTALVGTWKGEYAMDMLGFETQHKLMQTVTYVFAEDGTFTAEAGIPLDTINAFIDDVLEEHGKTCEEMFNADRQTVIDEVIAVTEGTIDNGAYIVDGTSVTMTADDFMFTAVLNGDVLTVDDGGIAYPCRKTEE